MKKILFIVIPFIGFIFIRFLHLSAKVKFHIPEKKLDENVIFVLWHGELLMQPFNYYKLKSHGKIATMISEHKDGELLARTMKYFHFDTIRGSSRRGAIKALKDAFNKADNGYDIAITPDGPKGPKGSVADGVVAIAQKKKMNVVALNYTAESFWQLKSWDKFIIPKPFTTIHFYASEPFSLEGMTLDEAKQIIKERLNTHAHV